MRIQDGSIVAIGGLVHIESSQAASGLPGTRDVPVLGTLLGNRLRAGRKKEVVVLIKSTVIRTAQDWEAQSLRVREALDDMSPVRPRAADDAGGLTRRQAFTVPVPGS